jgi:hypothetical protein
MTLEFKGSAVQSNRESVVCVHFLVARAGLQQVLLGMLDHFDELVEVLNLDYLRVRVVEHVVQQGAVGLTLKELGDGVVQPFGVDHAAALEQRRDQRAPHLEGNVDLPDYMHQRLNDRPEAVRSSAVSLNLLVGHGEVAHDVVNDVEVLHKDD